jgi:hypothetical protein
MNNLAAIDQLRVSVATYNRVVFAHPEDGTPMLALERKARVMEDGSISVRAQPFGGGVHILNPTPLQNIVGEIRFDSEQSRYEKDFRILIPPSKWELIKEYCLRHLTDEEDIELESVPHRELAEEFAEASKVYLSQDHYAVRPLGFVIENSPVRTENADARGLLTVRLYRIFEVQIVDLTLCRVMLTVNGLYSAQDLRARALRNFEDYDKRRATTILTLPLESVKKTYLALPLEQRYRKLVIDGHELDESVLAILMDVEVPQYQRL